MPRIVYASDLHASIPHYERLFETAIEVDADAVILGGDLLPDDLSGTNLARTQTAWIEQALAPVLVRYRVRGGKRVIAIPGNHDTVIGMEALSRTAIVEVIHGRGVELGRWLVVGCALTPPTPFIVKDFERADEPGSPPEPQPARAWISGTDGMVATSPEEHFRKHATIWQELNRLPFAEGRTMLVAHCPPFDTPLDLMYGPRHIGCRATRRFIEERKPAITLHGHIHEAPQLTNEYSTRIGPTLSLNAGQAGRTLQLLTIEVGRPGEKPFVEHRRINLSAERALRG